MKYKKQPKAGRADARRCSKCELEKAVTEFYCRSGKPDAVCKECKKRDQKKNYKAKIACKDSERLGEILNFVIQGEIDRVQHLTQQMDYFIADCQSKKPA